MVDFSNANIISGVRLLTFSGTDTITDARLTEIVENVKTDVLSQVSIPVRTELITSSYNGTDTTFTLDHRYIFDQDWSSSGVADFGDVTVYVNGSAVTSGSGTLDWFSGTFTLNWSLSSTDRIEADYDYTTIPLDNDLLLKVLKYKSCEQAVSNVYINEAGAGTLKSVKIGSISVSNQSISRAYEQMMGKFGEQAKSAMNDLLGGQILIVRSEPKDDRTLDNLIVDVGVIHSTDDT